MHADRQLKGVSDPLVNDTTDREAVGAEVVIIGIDVARVEAQGVPVGRIARCRHPVVAVRANDVELATGCNTIARGWEE